MIPKPAVTIRKIRFCDSSPFQEIMPTAVIAAMLIIGKYPEPQPLRILQNVRAALQPPMQQQYKTQQDAICRLLPSPAAVILPGQHIEQER